MSVNDDFSTVPRDPRHRAEWIKMKLRVAGSSSSKVAAKLGLSHSTISTVIRGHRTSKRIYEAVAKELGLPVTTIWPEVYSDSPSKTEYERGYDDGYSAGKSDALAVNTNDTSKKGALYNHKDDLWAEAIKLETDKLSKQLSS